MRLLFKLSGTHDVNEELRRHSEREGGSQYMFCGEVCESVAPVMRDIQNMMLLGQA